ncbi:MAG: ATP-dependent DNA helicase RecG [Gammaproteobacteria bacterium]
MATARPLTLDDPVARLSGVGPRVRERLERLGVTSIRDVLYHLPLRYQDRTRLTAIGALAPKMEVVIEGQVLNSQVQFGRRRSLLVRLEDDTGTITLRFFHFNREQQLRMSPGCNVRCFGEVRRGPQSLEMVHPECRFPAVAGDLPTDTALTPVYPTTEGLHQVTWRRLTEQALQVLAEDRDDTAALDRLVQGAATLGVRLPPLDDALRFVHRPPPGAVLDTLWSGAHPAQLRLAIEELLAHQLSLRKLRQRTRAHRAPRFGPAAVLRDALGSAFGFRLTAAQRRVVREIDADLSRAHPMLRLLQGDVGAGKTAVAALCATRALASGFQVALMAPTELLADQHVRTLTRWFEPCGIEVVGLTGRLTTVTRRQRHALLAEPVARVIVGTHALFQADVAFARLGLVIVDEQHRFGVDQRLALLDKGARGDARPHQLIMTATPIPRTLAMTAYADLDVSVLDELPPNRRPVKTTVLAEARREDVVQRIADACASGRQAYWVCPLIEESEQLDSQAATDTATQLAQALPDLRVGLVHGRLKDAQKRAVMQAFLAREIDLLVATTVIEVGVDVPNASLMIIENAERLGLSQLHQLRGRVGRGDTESVCVLLYKGPLGETARARLQTMRETNDGFVIAERDLDLRGPGEVLGTRQTGAAAFKIADLSRDRAVLPAVRTLADRLLGEDPALGERLVRRWLTTRLDYAKV